MRKVLVRSLKIAGILFLTLFIVITGGIIWVLSNPQSAWKLAEEKFLPKDMKITWNQLDLRTDHLSGLNFYINWKIEGLHIKKGQPFMDMPVQLVHIESSIFPMKKHAIVHQLKVQAPAELQFTPGPSKEETVEKNPFEQVQGIISLLEKFRRFVDIENLNVNVNEFVLNNFETKAKTISINFEAVQNKAELPDILNFTTNLKLIGEAPIAIQSAGEVNFGTETSKRPLVKAKVEVKGSGIDTTQEININYANEKADLEINGPLTYTKDKLKITSQIKSQTQLTETGADLNLSADVSGIPAPYVKVKTIKAKMNTPFEAGVGFSTKPSNITVTSPIELYFVDPRMRPALIKSCQCQIPSVVQAKFEGQVWLATLLSEPTEQLKMLDIKIDIESVKNKFFTLDAAGEIRIDKKLKEFIISPQIDLLATAHTFKGLQSILNANGIMVPAPLDVLDGTVDLKMSGPVKTDKDGLTFPSLTTVNLRSTSQKVDVVTIAEIHLDSDYKGAQVNVQAKINQLQLELPPFDPVKGSPKIVPDKRILKAPRVAKKPSQFKLTLNIEAATAEAGAIRLLSPYFKPYLPVSVNFKMDTGKTNQGKVTIEPFTVQYLRRQVHLVNMALQLPDEKDEPIDIDGRLRVNQTEYTIFIDIKGTSTQPQIILSSIPYLPHDEIISVLLYDRKSDQLASGDAESAGNVQAAVADKAIGLFGIWALASTSIKGFSYNTVTKVYSATVQVAEDVTASVGTNWEAATQVELRKRVSRQWVLTAAWAPANQEEEARTKLVLQWEKRF